MCVLPPEVAFVGATPVVRPARRQLQSASNRAGGRGLRRCARGRAVVRAAVEQEVKFSSEQQWRGLLTNAGVWEGNLSHYDGGKRNSRIGDTLYILPQETDEREDGVKGPRTVWVQLQRASTRAATQVYFHYEDLVAKGMLFSEKGDMDAGLPRVTSAGGGYFEQMCTGYDDDGTNFGRVRIVHVAHRGGEFKEWSVFRERRSATPLPMYFSDLTKTRVPPDEVADTDHPWLDRPSVSGDTFDALVGEWRGETSQLHVAERRRESKSFRATVSRSGGMMNATYDFGDSAPKLELRGQNAAEGAIKFDGGYVLRDLGDGVTVLTPESIPEDASASFFVEMGWVIGDRRWRVTRYYTNGQWTSTCYHTERRG